MEEASFDPYDLRPLASLNRRSIIALPGVDPELVGKTGYDLLSKAALIALIRPHVQELGFAGVDPAHLPEALTAALESPERAVRDRAAAAADAVASAVAEEYGRRLGYLIASILLSPQGLTSPLVPWEAAYLEHWKTAVRCIVLGGGLSNGRFGQLAGPVVEGVLARCGLPGLSIRVAENPSFLPLIGAARHAPDGIEVGGTPPQCMVVADFGGSRAKRGIAFYGPDGTLCRLRLLPSRDIEALTGPGKTAELAGAMASLIGETIQKADPDTPLADKVVCSVAAYVEDGQPMRIDRGSYCWLHQISPDLKGWFSQQIGATCSKTVEVEFVHDCDMAACAFAGQPYTAVVMLGTALGVGFVPPGERCRPISSQFVVDHEGGSHDGENGKTPVSGRRSTDREPS